MAAGGAHLYPRVILVGDQGSHFVQEAAHLAGEYELAVAQCDDVYSAVTELTRDGGPALVIAETFRKLARGNGGFFTVVERYAAHCCCLLDAERGIEHDQVLAAVRRGVRLAGGMTDVREFLKDALAAGTDSSQAADEDNLFSEESRASEAELQALLGHQGNE